jgi:hypothetical protein
MDRQWINILAAIWLVYQLFIVSSAAIKDKGFSL